MTTFPGGVHPDESKHYTENKPIIPGPEPKKVYIPLIQHTGAPCDPLVKVGDKVTVGQKIGESKSLVTAPVHSSISGTVVAIEPTAHPVNNKKVTAIVIESDGLNTLSTDLPVRIARDVIPNPDEIRTRIKDAGLVGLGGAGFPTTVKLSPPKDKKVDTFILNAAECEPFLTCDYRLLLEHTDEILTGVRLAMHCLSVTQGYIAIEDNKPAAIQVLTDKLKNSNTNIQLKVLKTKYPQGGEKQLIYSLLRRRVLRGGLPFDVGVIVSNVATVYSVYQAVYEGLPLTTRVVTVTGNGITNPQNVQVKIGTTVGEVISFVNNLSPTESTQTESGTVPNDNSTVTTPSVPTANNNGTEVKLILGGPMMGIAQYTTDVPVIKGTSGIILTRESDTLTEFIFTEKQYPCVRCGKCVDTCPMQLTPCFMGLYIENRKFDLAVEYGLKDCIECGACAYICPAKRPLVHLFKFAKSQLPRK